MMDAYQNLHRTGAAGQPGTTFTSWNKAFGTTVVRRTCKPAIGLGSFKIVQINTAQTKEQQLLSEQLSAGRAPWSVKLVPGQLASNTHLHIYTNGLRNEEQRDRGRFNLSVAPYAWIPGRQRGCPFPHLAVLRPALPLGRQTTTGV
jgi:hypothetical protein